MNTIIPILLFVLSLQTLCYSQVTYSYSFLSGGYSIESFVSKDTIVKHGIQKIRLYELNYGVNNQKHSFIQTFEFEFDQNGLLLSSIRKDKYVVKNQCDSCYFYRTFYNYDSIGNLSQTIYNSIYSPDIKRIKEYYYKFSEDTIIEYNKLKNVDGNSFDTSFFIIQNNRIILWDSSSKNQGIRYKYRNDTLISSNSAYSKMKVEYHKKGKNITRTFPYYSYEIKNPDSTVSYYDIRNRLTRIIHTYYTGLKKYWYYEYDENGKLEKVSLFYNEKPYLIDRYIYYSNGLLKSITSEKPDGSNTIATYVEYVIED